jgi:DNA-binding NtrC family response regulator
MDIKSQSIVAVDNDVRTLDRIRTILEGTHTVWATADAKRALAWLQNDPTVIAVLVGHDLNGGQALGLLDAARNVRPEARRILIANYSDLANFVEGLHTGAIQRTISKPIDAAELMGLVRVRPVVAKSGTSANIAVA